MLYNRLNVDATITAGIAAVTVAIPARDAAAATRTLCNAIAITAAVTAIADNSNLTATFITFLTTMSTATCITAA